MAYSAPLLRPEQFERYRRHLYLPDFGVEGQRRLLEGSVLLIGAGGLGCPVAQYLAAAGVGRIGLVDFDVVDESNLQRQVLYGTADVGRPKVEVARERIEAMNPDVAVETYQERLSSGNALAMLGDYEVVVDGTDNFPTRYLSNDACVLLEKPNVYGAILRFDGQASTFDSQRGPCYRCLFPEPPPPGTVPDCAEGGVLGVLPGIIAMIQSTETLKLLARIGEPLIGRLLHVNALEMKFSEFRVAKDPQCPVCSAQPRIRELIDYEGFCGVGGVEESPLREVSATEVKRLADRREAFLLLDVRDSDEFEKAHIEGSTLVPLSQVEARLGELEAWRECPVVVHCHRGGRSVKACRVLLGAGFRDVAALSGGIEAWSLTVDPEVPRY
jgi:adenylyltransferase/sulfurtransferase